MGDRTPGLSSAQAVQAARRALADQTEDMWAGPVTDAAVRTGDDPLLWQYAALLHRALDDRRRAIDAYERAVALAPRDVRIVHGLARTRWEAGLPAQQDYARALALAPYDGDILLGRAAAQIAAGDRAGALAGIDTVLAQESRWIEGQRQAANLRFMAGDRIGFVAGVERAIANHPDHEGLRQLLLILLQQAGDHERLARATAATATLVGDRPYVVASRAIAASAMGDRALADASFGNPLVAQDADVVVHHVRHLLRTGRAGRASSMIDPWLGGPHAAAFAPYAAIAWRLTGDPRVAWLDGAPALVRTFDLSDRLPPLDRLAATLRALHRGGGDPLDQSVRGGSQTDGVLLASIDADLEQTRDAIVDAVRAYVDGLPPVDPRHPTLARRRDRRPRFAGSWSVRLRGSGRHANHMHPDGWISSALYVALPRRCPGEPVDAGWLTLGEPPIDLATSLGPQASVEPVAGRLVLFPSTMWHGTLPFADGERLTIAFDIAPPLH